MKPKPGITVPPEITQEWSCDGSSNGREARILWRRATEYSPIIQVATQTGKPPLLLPLAI